MKATAKSMSEKAYEAYIQAIDRHWRAHTAMLEAQNAYKHAQEAAMQALKEYNRAREAYLLHYSKRVKEGEK